MLHLQAVSLSAGRSKLAAGGTVEELRAVRFHVGKRKRDRDPSARVARVDGVRSCWPEDHEVEGARARAGAGRWSAQLRWWSWGCGPLSVGERTREEGPGVVGPCMPRAMAGQKAEASRKEGRKGEVFSDIRF